MTQLYCGYLIVYLFMHSFTCSCLVDNCPGWTNTRRDDSDRDTEGDACDDNDDNDGRVDYEDKCKYVKDDELGGVDDDNDKIGKACDNCNLTNVGQADSDRDGVGDACDKDDDNDGIPDSSDVCPSIPNKDQKDSDGDKIGDLCDNCPEKKNFGQVDADYDFVGDVCDNDLDQDSDVIQEDRDNCPKTANADQVDADSDGKGDLCDPDADNDGIPNESDNCVQVENRNQQYCISDNWYNCQSDNDQDGVPNWDDGHENNSRTNRTHFGPMKTVLLIPNGILHGPSNK